VADGARLTREQLAERVGASVSQIAAWEHGKSGIRLEDQLRLTSALNIIPRSSSSRPA
jgi:transcriptional regulator with XRE-family HTH domain